MLVFPVA
jgi:hypothetical protein